MKCKKSDCVYMFLAFDQYPCSACVGLDYMYYLKNTNYRESFICKEHDPVNNPAHYTKGGVNVADAIEAWGLNFNHNRASAIEYIVRAGDKDKSMEVQDLKKAIWRLNREIAYLEKK